jgi:hypothetical protein
MLGGGGTEDYEIRLGFFKTSSVVSKNMFRWNAKIVGAGLHSGLLLVANAHDFSAGMLLDHP